MPILNDDEFAKIRTANYSDMATHNLELSARAREMSDEFDCEYFMARATTYALLAIAWSK